MGLIIGLIAKIGLIRGIFASILVLGSLEYVVCMLFGVQMLNSVDKNTLFDNKNNRCIISCCFIFEKFDDTDRVVQLYKNVMPSKWKRMRSRLVKILGAYYMQELP